MARYPLNERKPDPGLYQILGAVRLHFPDCYSLMNHRARADHTAVKLLQEKDERKISAGVQKKTPADIPVERCSIYGARMQQQEYEHSCSLSDVIFCFRVREYSER